MGSFINYFYTDVLGISALAASTIFLIARAWDAVHDPLFASIMDTINSHQHHHQRRHKVAFIIAVLGEERRQLREEDVGAGNPRVHPEHRRRHRAGALGGVVGHHRRHRPERDIGDGVQRPPQDIRHPGVGIMDTINSRFGKFRHFLLIAPLLITGVTLLSFYKIEADMTTKILYAGVTYILWGTLYAISPLNQS